MDHIGGKVEGSITFKKYICNKIWSLISFKDASSWYITLSPADIKHPICIYFADNNETFKPDLQNSNKCLRLVTKNPVADVQ